VVRIRRSFGFETSANHSSFLGPRAQPEALELAIPRAPLLDRPDTQVRQHRRALRAQRGHLVGGRKLAVDDDEVVLAEPRGDLVGPAGEVAVADREGEASRVVRIARPHRAGRDGEGQQERAQPDHG
jgi:hypothetical protein